MLIDHVLLATRDIEATAQHLLSRYGLASVPGGTHPEWGTGNRIVPLGDQYLEIIGIVDAARAAANPLGQWIIARTERGPTLAGVMVEPDDFDAECARLSLAPMPGHRTLPDGSTVSWQLAGFPDALLRSVPCFITWETRQGRLGGSPPSGGITATGVRSMQLGGDGDAIRSWLGHDVPEIQLVGGLPGIRELAVAVGDEDVVIPECP